MNDFVEEFDPARFADREPEVLAVLAQHLAALNLLQLQRLPRDGAVLVELQVLENGAPFGPSALKVALVDLDESVEEVETRVGMTWISSFGWLKSEDEKCASPTSSLRCVCHKEILKQALSYNWFELVLWALEERWLDGLEGP